MQKCNIQIQEQDVEDLHSLLQSLLTDLLKIKDNQNEELCLLFNNKLYHFLSTIKELNFYPSQIVIDLLAINYFMPSLIKQNFSQELSLLYHEILNIISLKNLNTSTSQRDKYIPSTKKLYSLQANIVYKENISI